MALPFAFVVWGGFGEKPAVRAERRVAARDNVVAFGDGGPQGEARSAESSHPLRHAVRKGTH